MLRCCHPIMPAQTSRSFSGSGEVAVRMGREGAIEEGLKPTRVARWGRHGGQVDRYLASAHLYHYNHS